MKKIIAIVIAAVAAVVALTAAVSAPESITTEGKVSIESSAVPALNCTMSIDRVGDIYRLVPGNIDDVCRKEYIAIREKCGSRSRFTHEGVNVQVKDNGGTVTMVFSITGYKLTVSDVTWKELDNIFIGPNGNS